MPLADASSIVLDLESSVLDDLRKQVESQTTAALAKGQKALYARLAAAIQRIATQCGKEDGRIYDSLTGNLDEMLKVLPDLNLSGDPQFAELCRQAQELVVSPVAIKTIPEVRQSVASKADEILASMRAFV